MGPWDLGARSEIERGRGSCSLFSYNEVIVIVTFKVCFSLQELFRCFISFDLKNNSVIKAGQVFIIRMYVCVFVSLYTYMCI